MGRLADATVAKAGGTINEIMRPRGLRRLGWPLGQRTLDALDPVQSAVTIGPLASTIRCKNGLRSLRREPGIKGVLPKV